MIMTKRSREDDTDGNTDDDFSLSSENSEDDTDDDFSLSSKNSVTKKEKKRIVNMRNSSSTCWACPDSTCRVGVPYHLLALEHVSSMK